MEGLLPLLFQTPWDWLTDRFGFAPAYRGALFLLAGGLFIAGLITVTLLTVQAVNPGNGNPYALLYRPRADTLVDPRRRRVVPRLPEATLKPTSDPAASFLKGRMAGRTCNPAALDDVLEKAILAGLGEPRILRSTHSQKLVRFYACATCDAVAAAHREGRPHVATACEFERGFLTGGFEALLGMRVVVKEIRCRRMGGAQCEFMVQYGAPEQTPDSPLQENKR